MDIPTLIPAQNNHRVVHFTGNEPPRDFERLEEIAADGIAAARDALALLPLLPTHLFNQLHGVAGELLPHVSDRRLLNGRARQHLEAVVEVINRLRLQVDSEDEALFGEIGRNIIAALDASNRVADLLAAEKEIGWLRGIREPQG
ncbi:hypothetical protein GQF56_21725 [Rhodobacter sphaeroides]|jgi:hypothetical protein|uniref:Uncharacterized protein n=1 Tax=Cereibacter sphaeroides (strain ATCC 17023 / DSM 158 / JCM 6121 / CCUG 31486 / LMG 2827 / NBRC 12203 / NCIMB 8253 / ATH 2.4.1.) TaxID=272943 RepID=Q3IV60_CERS4|nr:hypothetical protein [Cereibacter sphaeroides]ABA81574.1 hypothetical protein RSP_4105 [Cereibacter sphaeroides 2.4.1]AMJ50117.1 hypothetical protein APX01_21430 [Cereibacter sphaeroides]ANS36739.1 hypothetical protein A3858_20980 [Cereibacter sphaeroides]ATN65922.1 hypothetical protein A3857_21635 [Cereibacter sphaeroides]AXC64001.1 hypothetical protein DQL45_21670 [Cereibacter sphaeroides 2.4.1]